MAAAQAGAEVIRPRYGTELSRFDKAVLDFATDVDIASERAVRQVLASARPDDAIEGEELGGSGDPSAPRRWLVDPLCGTSNFAARLPLFAVNVALQVLERDQGWPSVAAAADPIGEELFWTDGDRAFARRGGTDHALVPSAATALIDFNIEGPYPEAHGFEATRMLADPAFMESFRSRVVASSLALPWIAAGRLAGYVTAGNIRDNVHFSAGVALCRAAGCVVTGLRGQPLYTGVGGLLVAADQPTHDALVALVEKQFG